VLRLYDHFFASFTKSQPPSVAIVTG
jgi:hypothetical protein